MQADIYAKIKTFLLVTPPLSAFIKNRTPGERDIEIIGHTDKVSEAAAVTAGFAVNPGDMVVLADNHILSADADFIQTLKQAHILPVVIVDSANEGFKYLERGAADIVVRNSINPECSDYFVKMLLLHVKEAALKERMDRRRSSMPRSNRPVDKIIAIGSSTGGTETVLHILKELPGDMPPILLVQHMPPVFTKMYAQRVDSLCALSAFEARDGDMLAYGQVLIAPGDYHMTLQLHNGTYSVACKKGEKVCGQCPSVDVLFESVAQTARVKTIGLILTGMGADGANGLLQMRKQGAYTIGQDAESSIVYGMPRAAYEQGAVMKQLPLKAIAQHLIEHAR